MEWTGLANISKISREGLHRALAESAAGIDAHEQEAIAFFKMFPDQHLINNPYKIMLAQREWTCTVADFTGTMKGPMTMPDGAVIPPTNKSFHVDFCTVARWNEQRQIVEENLFYDLMGMLKQIGIMPGQAHVTTSDSIMAERMPALFIGHGNPMNALLVNPYTQRWTDIGVTLPRPKAILSVSAHWYIEDAAVTVSTGPKTIHDFGGFPREVYQVQYPAPGDPDLAARVQKLLAPVPVRRDDRWVTEMDEIWRHEDLVCGSVILWSHRGYLRTAQGHDGLDPALE